MENSIIRSIRQIEEECEDLKTKAYVDKNNIIENDEETVRKMELDFQNLKQLMQELKYQKFNQL